MKTSTTLCWLCGSMLVALGALTGCQHATSNQPQQAQEVAGLYRQTALRTEAADVTAPKKPKPGRKPRTTADYNSAIDAVKKYRKEHQPGEILNGYFSKKLVKDLLANGKCEGLRVYLADSAGQTKMVVIGVDKDGADLVTPINLEQAVGGSSTQGRYLFGISEERCPQNCEGSALYE